MSDLDKKVSGVENGEEMSDEVKAFLGDLEMARRQHERGEDTYQEEDVPEGQKAVRKEDIKAPEFDQEYWDAVVEGKAEIPPAPGFKGRVE